MGESENLRERLLSRIFHQLKYVKDTDELYSWISYIIGGKDRIKELLKEKIEELSIQDLITLHEMFVVGDEDGNMGNMG